VQRGREQAHGTGGSREGPAPVDLVYPVGYTGGVVELRKTEVFVRWIDGLTDAQARGRILARIERLATGNPGDVAPVGDAVSELRIHCGPGYRVYFTRSGKEIVILLAGGDKSTQAKDIKLAIQLARNL
jgi:putative addiction module killer protein